MFRTANGWSLCLGDNQSGWDNSFTLEFYFRESIATVIIIASNSCVRIAGFRVTLCRTNKGCLDHKHSKFLTWNQRKIHSDEEVSNQSKITNVNRG